MVDWLVPLEVDTGRHCLARRGGAGVGGGGGREGGGSVAGPAGGGEVGEREGWRG